jgi:O-acetylhomoserine/O-acetylserine sulfhydrylase-like pyridoxal-dependent enzyme
MAEGKGFSTRAIHGARVPPVDQEAPSVPIFQTATFRFETAERYADTISFKRPGYTYTRGYGNPTVNAFEAVMANLEGTDGAFGFASGMAAIHTTLTALAASGDRIVASTELYGGTYSLMRKILPRYGVDVTFVDAHDPDAVREARAPSTARRSRTRTSRSLISRRSGRSVATRASRPSSTTRSRRRTSAHRPRTGSTSCCTRRRSTSRVTAT